MTLFVFALIISVLTFLPLVRTGFWLVRIMEFPRVQLAAFAFFILIVQVFLCSTGILPVSLLGIATTLLLLFTVWYQSRRIVPFTPFFSPAVPSHNPSLPQILTALRVLVANVCFENQAYETFLNIVKDQPVDVLVILELNAAWQTALRPLSDIFPCSKEVVREDGHGIAIYSRFPLKNAAVHHLVSERRPSIKATISPERNLQIDLWAIHPAPPAIMMENGERKDSRPRDAELLVLAEKITNSARRPCIVLGDFNDTAWSHTTELFKQKSGLLDPRVGRGFYNTYPTQSKLLRYPIDHVFLTKHFSVHALQRLANFGSDHFPMLASVSIAEGQCGKEQGDGDYSAEHVEEVIEEGKEQAEEYKKYDEVPP